MDDDVKKLPRAHLRPPKIQLRPVRKQSVAFLELRESIKADGILNSILVRPTSTPDVYEVVDGFWRFSCCEMLGIETIPCIIKELTDSQVLAIQIQTNAIRPETTPVEFAKQLKRIQVEAPNITMTEMVGMVKKCGPWIKAQLSLLELPEEVQQQVDRDEIPLSNAYMLAKLPEGIRPKYIDDARNLSCSEFRAVAIPVIQAVQIAIKTGKLEKWYLKAFKPYAYLRPLKAVLAEMRDKVAGATTIVRDDLKTPIEGWVAALEWVASLDKDSATKQQRAAEKLRTKNTIKRLTNETLDDEPSSTD